MIPLSDPQTPRQSTPVVVWTIIALNIIVFLYELSLGSQLELFIFSYGAIPLEMTTGRDIPPPGPTLIWFTAFTSMFMHGGWMHVGGNMLYLWVFGDNIEDVLGKTKFIFFYLASGLAALGAQILVDPSSPVPTIGASGAIAGVLGAYLVLYPRSQITTVIFFGYFIRLIPVPALFYLGLWFVMQFFSGVASLGAATQGGVAYFAHIGGFAAGVGLLFLFGGRRLARPPMAPPSLPPPSDEEDKGFW